MGAFVSLSGSKVRDWTEGKNPAAPEKHRDGGGSVRARWEWGWCVREFSTGRSILNYTEKSCNQQRQIKSRNECSILMRLWSKVREEFDAEINLGNCDQFIRLGRVSCAHQPGKWVILKSAMSGLNINVHHKSSRMLSSSRLKNSNHQMMTLVFRRNIKLLSFGNSASC